LIDTGQQVEQGRFTAATFTLDEKMFTWVNMQLLNAQNRLRAARPGELQVVKGYDSLGHGLL